jgi:hypothetical protein
LNGGSAFHCGRDRGHCGGGFHKLSAGNVLVLSHIPGLYQRPASEFGAEHELDATRRAGPGGPCIQNSVMRPKLAEVLIERFEPLPATDPTLAPGVLNSGWFSRLNAAARKFSFTRSDTRNRFCKEESIS